MSLEFPRHVFRNGGEYARRNGTFSCQIVRNEKEYADFLSNGWSATIDSLDVIEKPIEISAEKEFPKNRKKVG